MAISETPTVPWGWEPLTEPVPPTQVTVPAELVPVTLYPNALGAFRVEYERELEQGNLDFLRSTHLTWKEIHRGKFWAAACSGVGIVAAATWVVVGVDNAACHRRPGRDAVYLLAAIHPIAAIVMANDAPSGWTLVYLGLAALINSLLTLTAVGRLGRDYAVER